MVKIPDLEQNFYRPYMASKVFVLCQDQFKGWLATK